MWVLHAWDSSFLNSLFPSNFTLEFKDFIPVSITSLFLTGTELLRVTFCQTMISPSLGHQYNGSIWYQVLVVY